ncbi:MAG: hypothetical protein U0Y68_23290 [Blastocatellia bacterium]
MKTFTWLSTIAVTLATFAIAAAQTPAPSGLKILGFSFTPKSTSHLEMVELPNNPAIRPTDTANLGAEYRSEPTNDSRYYKYEKREERSRYATVRVKNESAKAIKAIQWEFTDPHFNGDKEIGYSEGQTKMQLAAGQSAVLVQRVPDHPTCGMAMRVTAGAGSMAGNCGRSQRKMTRYYPIEARLKKVFYADGTVWIAP